MRKVCIICHTEIANDPRVLRQIESLSKCFDITVIGNGTPIPNVRFFAWNDFYHVAKNKVEFLFYALCHLVGLYGQLLRRFSTKKNIHLNEEYFDLVLVNELISVPLAFLIAKGSPVHCDLHEYYLDSSEKSFREWLTFKYYRWMCVNMLPKCTGLSTVSRGLQDKYVELTGKLPLLVINAPHGQDLPVHPVRDNKIRLIHHGYADSRRKLENIIEMMDYVDDRFTLTLMLSTENNYKQKIEKMAELRPNVLFREPVRMVDICKVINEYDLGIVFYETSELENIKFMLPNKIFECIQARLGVIVGALIETKTYIEKYHIGSYIPESSPRMLASVLNALTIEEIDTFKVNANKNCGLLTAETSQSILLHDILRQIESTN